MGYPRSAQACVPTPEQYRQHDHEERVSSEVGSERKVRVQRWRAQLFLQECQVWGLPSYYWYKLLA